MLFYFTYICVHNETTIIIIIPLNAWENGSSEELE